MFSSFHILGPISGTNQFRESLVMELSVLSGSWLTVVLLVLCSLLP